MTTSHHSPTRRPVRNLDRRVGTTRRRPFTPRTEITAGIPDAASSLAALEARHGSRLGVYAFNHQTGTTVSYRADERFAFCSVYRSLLAAHVLRDIDDDQGALGGAQVAQDRIGSDSATGIYRTIAAENVRPLCATMVAREDNMAANLLFKLAGGPAGLTRFLRSLGDEVTRSDRTEPELNTAFPGDPRDTTTPRAIARNFTKVLVGDALAKPDQAQLRSWMERDGGDPHRFRAGLPNAWRIADQSGSGNYGTTNDVGVVWTGAGTPLTIAVLSTAKEIDAPEDAPLIAVATRIVAGLLAFDEQRPDTHEGNSK